MTKPKPTKQSRPPVLYGRNPVLLYNTDEASELFGLPIEFIMKAIKTRKAPTHYLTGDAVDIYFDEQALHELREVFQLDQRGANAH